MAVTVTYSNNVLTLRSLGNLDGGEYKETVDDMGRMRFAFTNEQLSVELSMRDWQGETDAARKFFLERSGRRSTSA